MSSENIKEKILESIQWAQDNLGYTLVSEDWGNNEKKCACALGCILLKNNSSSLDTLPARQKYLEAADQLDVDEAWVDSFIDGFDDTGSSVEAMVPAAWKLGAEIAATSKPVTYHEFAKNFLPKEDKS